jgi:uncharacterized RDD family membrane protein YckC
MKSCVIDGGIVLYSGCKCEFTIFFCVSGFEIFICSWWRAGGLCWRRFGLRVVSLWGGGVKCVVSAC